MAIIRANGFLMDYEDQGDGIPVLLIHGYPLNRAIWRPQWEGLSPTLRVLAPDLRGSGGSEPIKGPYSMDLLAEDCIALLDNLGVKQPVMVGGLSMGGYITLAIFRKYPNRVAGLILAATRAGADSAEGRANREKSITTAMEAGAPAIVDAMLPKMFAPVTMEKDKKLVRQVHEIMLATSVEGIIGDLQGMMDRPDSTSMLPQIDRPVLVLHGNDDQLIPVKEAETMAAAIPGAQLKVLPDSGHLLNMEQPELFNQAVHDFVVKNYSKVRL